MLTYARRLVDVALDPTFAKNHDYAAYYAQFARFIFQPSVAHVGFISTPLGFCARPPSR